MWLRSLLSLVLLLPLLGCRSLDLFDTRGDAAYCGELVSAPSFHDGLMPEGEPVSPLVLKLILPDGQARALDGFVLRDRTLEIATPDGLGPGTHVLTWRVVSEDGHPVAGSTIFSIGAPGISAAFMHYPDDGLVVIVLSNQDQGAEAMQEWLQAQVEASLFGVRAP